MKKIITVVVCLTLIVAVSVVTVNNWETNKIRKIEETVYPITVDLDSVEKNYRQGVPAYDWYDKAKHVGFMNNVFVCRVEKLVGTTYTDVSIDNGKVRGTPWTNYEVTVLGNIKGNLKTGITIPVRKWAGLNYDSTVLTMDEMDVLPKEGFIYIFCTFADEDGELYISCHESNILLGENCEDDVQLALSGVTVETENENRVIYTINEYQKAESKHDNSVAGDRERNSPKQEYLAEV